MWNGELITGGKNDDVILSRLLECLARKVRVGMYLIIRQGRMCSGFSKFMRKFKKQVYSLHWVI